MCGVYLSWYLPNIVLFISGWPSCLSRWLFAYVYIGTSSHIILSNLLSVGATASLHRQALSPFYHLSDQSYPCRWLMSSLSHSDDEERDLVPPTPTLISLAQECTWVYGLSECILKVDHSPFYRHQSSSSSSSSSPCTGHLKLQWQSVIQVSSFHMKNCMQYRI